MIIKLTLRFNDPLLYLNTSSNDLQLLRKTKMEEDVDGLSKVEKVLIHYYFCFLDFSLTGSITFT